MPLFRRREQAKDTSRPAGVPSPIDPEGRLRLQCWYCGEEIAYQGFDPCAVVLVANWDDESRQREQQFFAHAECFRRSGSGEELHILEPDVDQG
jgi:hypothetical protein